MRLKDGVPASCWDKYIVSNKRREVKRYTRGLPLLNLDKDIKVRTDKRWQHGEKRTNYGAETSTT